MYPSAAHLLKGRKTINITITSQSIPLSLVGSLLKNRKMRESVTSTGKTVDFRCVTIHVINVARSHFTVIMVMWFNNLSCTIGTIPGSSASYLRFRSSSLWHPQLCWVPWHTLWHVNSELQSMVSELVPRTNYRKLWSWTLWTCTSSAHPKTVFHQPSRCSLRVQFHFRADNFLLSGQNVTCTCGFVLQSDWYRQTKAAEVDNFSRGCLPGSFLSLFLRRESGDEAYIPLRGFIS